MKIHIEMIKALKTNKLKVFQLMMIAPLLLIRMSIAPCGNIGSRISVLGWTPNQVSFHILFLFLSKSGYPKLTHNFCLLEIITSLVIFICHFGLALKLWSNPRFKFSLHNMPVGVLFVVFGPKLNEWVWVSAQWNFWLFDN